MESYLVLLIKLFPQVKLVSHLHKKKILAAGRCPSVKLSLFDYWRHTRVSFYIGELLKHKINRALSQFIFAGLCRETLESIVLG